MAERREFSTEGVAGPVTGHNETVDGVPAGGEVRGTGFQIVWQHRPLGRGENRIPAEGAFPEDLMLAVIARLEFFQDSPFACQENADSITLVRAALERQYDRTRRREARGTEGTTSTDQTGQEDAT